MTRLRLITSSRDVSPIAANRVFGSLRERPVTVAVYSRRSDQRVPSPYLALSKHSRHQGQSMHFGKADGKYKGKI
jgi:hypothetical protein